MIEKSGAVIIGGHFQGLGVVRSLASQKISTVVIDHEPCIAQFSKHVQHFIKSPAPCYEKKFIHFLIHLSKQLNGPKWVVFPTDDLMLRILSKNKDQLKEYFHITTPSWDVTQYAYNKMKSYQLAEKIGIPIPKTHYPNSLDDIMQKDFSFPILIKPDVMNCFIEKTGKKIFRAKNRDELIHLYQKALSVIPKQDIMLQDEIPEIHNNLYSFCPMFKEGKVLAKIVAKRYRQHPMDFGRASTYVKTIHNNDLEKLGTKFLKTMKFYGLCEVEFAYDIRDNMYKFLEVNPRIWGWHSIAQKAGVNLPYLLYSDMNGKEISIPDFQTNKTWIHWITDMATCFVELIHGRLSFKEYVTSLQKIDETAVYNKHDFMPFIGELLLIPYLIKKRGF